MMIRAANEGNATLANHRPVRFVFRSLSAEMGGRRSLTFSWRCLPRGRARRILGPAALCLRKYNADAR